MMNKSEKVEPRNTGIPQFVRINGIVYLTTKTEGGYRTIKIR